MAKRGGWGQHADKIASPALMLLPVSKRCVSSGGPSNAPALKLGLSLAGCKNSLCVQNTTNRAILLLLHPTRVHVPHEEPLGAAEIATGKRGRGYGKWQRDVST